MDCNLRIEGFSERMGHLDSFTSILQRDGGSDLRLASMSARPGTNAALLCCCVLLVAFTGSTYSASAKDKDSPSPKPGSYSGFDAADTISFRVSADGKTITELSSTFNAAADCGVPTSGQHERFPTLQVKKGHFSGSTSVNRSGTIEHFAIQGKFISPTRATGKISGHFTIRSLPPCHASQGFTVKRKGK